ncbi:unnamed protein product, partial [Heterotrigona itama]
YKTCSCRPWPNEERDWLWSPSHTSSLTTPVGSGTRRTGEDGDQRLRPVP